MIKIPLAHGRGVALVDDEDGPLIELYQWHRHSAGYAANGARLYMHRLILATPAGVQVDHVNRNKLDNRRANLRIATVRENRGNTGLRSSNASGFKGVSRSVRPGRRDSWQAHITDHGKIRLGRYATAEEAAHVYDRAAREVFGEFAWLNYPEVRP